MILEKTRIRLICWIMFLASLRENRDILDEVIKLQLARINQEDWLTILNNLISKKYSWSKDNLAHNKRHMENEHMANNFNLLLQCYLALDNLDTNDKDHVSFLERFITQLYTSSLQTSALNESLILMNHYINTKKVPIDTKPHDLKNDNNEKATSVIKTHKTLNQFIILCNLVSSNENNFGNTIYIAYKVKNGKIKTNAQGIPNRYYLKECKNHHEVRADVFSQELYRLIRNISGYSEQPKTRIVRYPNYAIFGVVSKEIPDLYLFSAQYAKSIWSHKKNAGLATILILAIWLNEIDLRLNNLGISLVDKPHLVKIDGGFSFKNVENNLKYPNPISIAMLLNLPNHTGDTSNWLEYAMYIHHHTEKHTQSSTFPMSMRNDPTFRLELNQTILQIILLDDSIIENLLNHHSHITQPTPYSASAIARKNDLKKAALQDPDFQYYLLTKHAVQTAVDFSESLNQFKSIKKIPVIAYEIQDVTLPTQLAVLNHLRDQVYFPVMIKPQNIHKGKTNGALIGAIIGLIVIALALGLGGIDTLALGHNVAEIVFAVFALTLSSTATSSAIGLGIGYGLAKKDYFPFNNQKNNPCPPIKEIPASTLRQRPSSQSEIASALNITLIQVTPKTELQNHLNNDEKKYPSNVIMNIEPQLPNQIMKPTENIAMTGFKK